MAATTEDVFAFIEAEQKKIDIWWQRLERAMIKERRQAGITLKELAEATGDYIGNISDYERGKRKWPREKLKKAVLFLEKVKAGK